MPVFVIIVTQNMLENMNEPKEPSINTREIQQKPEEKGLKLPKIDKLPPRPGPREVKSSNKLPTIKNEASIQVIQPNTDRQMVTGQDFVGEVQRKIRLVLEQQQIAQIEQSEESDEDTFERKIIENKEIIKAAKRKNQRKKKENEHINNNLKFQPHLNRRISQNNKNEMYEKRMRQYKQGSVQNIYLQKKKQLVGSAQRNQQKDTNELKEVKNMNGALREYVSNKEINIKDVRSKGDLVPLNKIMPNIANNRSDLKSAEPRKLQKQLSHKILSPLQKNQQLFDAIHNYLQNPKKHDIQSVNPIKIGKERAELQKKLRWYEQKLNASACQDNLKLGLKHKLSLNSQEAQSNKSDIRLVTSTHWHKIGLSQRGIFAQQSTSFDKQIDRINNYLQRNEQSLQKYVHNQKLLVDVQLASRKMPANEKIRAQVRSQLQ